MMKFRSVFSVVLVACTVIVACSCSKTAKEGETDSLASQEGAPGTSAGAGIDSGAPLGGPGQASGSGGNIAPMAGVGTGGLTPVQGSESVQGGGSGVGQVMKEKAKDVAAQGGGGSVGNATDDGQ